MILMLSRAKIKHTGRSCSLTSAAGQQTKRKRSPISSWESSSGYATFQLEIWGHWVYFKSVSSKMTSQFFTTQQAKQQSTVVGFKLLLQLCFIVKCVCCVGSDFSVMFHLQGQLGLLHSLFKAALYDDHLSRVSMLQTLIFSMCESFISFLAKICSKLLKNPPNNNVCLQFWGPFQKAGLLNNLS